MEGFENALSDLVATWMKKGESAEDIVSAMEIQIMTLREEDGDPED